MPLNCPFAWWYHVFYICIRRNPRQKRAPRRTRRHAKLKLPHNSIQIVKARETKMNDRMEMRFTSGRDCHQIRCSRRRPPRPKGCPGQVNVVSLPLTSTLTPGLCSPFADQVTVAISVVNAADRWPELVRSQSSIWVDGLFAGVGTRR